MTFLFLVEILKFARHLENICNLYAWEMFSEKKNVGS